jgi:hypothetical protein
LLLIDPLCVVDVEAEKIDQLTGAVDLGLEGGLALAQHGGGVEQLPVGSGEQLGSPEKDRRPVLEAPMAPVSLGLHGRLDRRFDGGSIGLVSASQDSAMAVGRDHVMSPAGADLVTTHHGRYVSLPGADRTQCLLESRALGGSRRVAQHRLVSRNRNVPSTTHHSPKAR